jgi:hypothetical protein
MRLLLGGFSRSRPICDTRARSALSVTDAKDVGGVLFDVYSVRTGMRRIISSFSADKPIAFTMAGLSRSACRMSG